MAPDGGLFLALFVSLAKCTAYAQRAARSEELPNGAGTRNFWIDRGWIIEVVVDHNNLCQTMLYPR
jgi:hypothetical protein